MNRIFLCALCQLITQGMIIATMAQQPKLMLPIGHTDYVTYAQFSPEGKKIVTASRENTAKIWDAASGILLAVLKGHINQVASAQFSPDGKKIVTASWDNTAKIWDAASGAMLADLKGHTSSLRTAQFSPDGKKIVTSAYYENDARIWDANSGTLLAKLEGHTNEVISAQFNSDSKKIITCSRDNTAKIWDVASGKILADLKGHTKKVNSAQFSPDGKKIVTGSEDHTAKIWDAASGNILADLKGHTDEVILAQFSPDAKRIVTAAVYENDAKIWEASSGILLADLKGHTSWVETAQFSPDGKKVITASTDSTAKIWESASGTLLGELKGHTGFVVSAQFSPDGKKIVTASWDNTAKIWDAASGAMLADLKGHTKEVETVQFSPDGKKFITGSQDKTAKIWDASSGTLLTNLKGHTRWVKTAQFSPDGKKIVTTSWDKTTKIWDASSGKILVDLKDQTHTMATAQFSPDGKRIITASSDNTAKIWDASSGTLLTNLKGHTWWVNTAQFSPDGKKIVTASHDSTAKIWDASSGTLLANLKGHTSWVTTAQFSPDGKKVVTTSMDKTAKIWDVASGKVLADLKGHINQVALAQFSPDGVKILTSCGTDIFNNQNPDSKIWDVETGSLIATLRSETSAVMSAQFSNDGKKIVTTAGDYANHAGENIVKIWDAATGKVLADLIGHIGGVKTAQFSPNGKNVITASLDNTVKIWDVENGVELYTFFAVDSSDYLIVDKYNHYDGTPGARNLLYFTCGTEVIGLDQVKDQLWVPHLAERIMKGEPINAKTLNDLDICGLTPEIETIEAGSGEYLFKIIPRRGGLGETVLYVNGIEAARFTKEQLTRSGNGYELKLFQKDLKNFFMLGQENPVNIKAFTTDNTISSRGAKYSGNASNVSKDPPNLFAVMIGVSDYKGDELDLKYAAKDATDISAAIGLAAKKMLNTDGKEHVFMYNLTTLRGHYLLPEKISIEQTLLEIGKKASANDILLIFFAGHGIMEGEKKQFYFLTADASKSTAADAIADVGISTAELTEWIKPQNIKAQKRILIFDACNSGQAIKDFVQLGTPDKGYVAARNDESSQQIKAIDKLNEKSGLFILSASASNQSAYELGRYSQGLLTYSLLKAIKQQPDILEEGKYLNISRWFNAAEKTVSELARESGARQEPQIVSNTNFNIGIIDEDVLAKIVLPNEKPMFTVSILMNNDEAADGDDLELSKLINDELNEISTRGTESRIIYVTGTNSTDAYALNGRYEIKGNSIIARISIRQNKEVKHRFEISGTKDNLKELARAIADKATGLAK